MPVSKMNMFLAGLSPNVSWSELPGPAAEPSSTSSALTGMPSGLSKTERDVKLVLNAPGKKETEKLTTLKPEPPFTGTENRT